VLAAEHLLGLSGVDLGFERVERAHQIGADVFPTLRPFDEDAEVFDFF
jgi:hypothetical protein